ncbi:hypothetical protein HDG37_005123 [Paraburkholderia sp. MM5384-R2]|nr:hypothetical protein [Paraburkholderia sp. MM5384-R2]
MLTITDGVRATSGSGTYLAFDGASGGLPPSAGTIVVSNGGLLTSPLLVIGSSGAADLPIKSNGTVTISGKTIVGAIAGPATAGGMFGTNPAILHAATILSYALSNGEPAGAAIAASQDRGPHACAVTSNQSSRSRVFR